MVKGGKVKLKGQANPRDRNLYRMKPAPATPRAERRATMRRKPKDGGSREAAALGEVVAGASVPAAVVVAGVLVLPEDEPAVVDGAEVVRTVVDGTKSAGSRLPQVFVFLQMFWRVGSVAFPATPSVSTTLEQPITDYFKE